MSAEVPTSADGPQSVLARRRAAKIVGFAVAGLPTFLLALPLNWFLASKMHLPKPGVYACVLACQTSANFFICRWFVFKEERRRPILSRFVPFLSGMVLFRAADWAVYTVLVSFLGQWYLAIQVGNAIFFSLTKFAYVRKVMEN